MSANRFRAWTGSKMFYDVAVDSDGVALRPTGVRIGRKRRFIREPKWIVTRWTGFVDGAGDAIYCHDIVDLTWGTGKLALAPVLFKEGRFVVLVPWNTEPENQRPLSLYCQPAYIRTVRIAGHGFEEKWSNEYARLPLSFSGGSPL